MKTLIIVYNTLDPEISLLQASVLKCVCCDARNYFARSNINSFSMPYLSWDLFAYFNMSPNIFHRREFETALVNSTDSGMDLSIIEIAYNMGWRYNFKTMKRAVMKGAGISTMRALREVGCHWGSETLDLLIAKSCTHDISSQLDFCLEDGYPVLEEHVVHAARAGTAHVLGSVCNALLLTGSQTRIYQITHILQRRIEVFDMYTQFSDAYFEDPGPFPRLYSELGMPRPEDTCEIIDDLWTIVGALRDTGLLTCNWTRVAFDKN